MVLTVLHTSYIPGIIVLNFGVIFSVAMIKGLQTPQNYVLCCIALADILHGVIIIPLDVFTLFAETFWHDFFWCWLRLSLYRLMEGLGLSFLMLMTIERYFSVVYVFSYTYITKGKVIAAALILTCLEVIVGPILISRLMEFVQGYSVCHFAEQLPDFYIIVFDFGKHILQLTLSVVLTVRVAMVSWKQLHLIHKLERSLHADIRHQKRMVQVKISISLMFIYVIGWLPSMGVPILEHISKTSTEIWGLPIFDVLAVYSEVTKHLVSINAFLNPIVYAYMKPTYKTAILYLIRHRPADWGKLPQHIRDVEGWMSVHQGLLLVSPGNGDTVTEQSTYDGGNDDEKLSKSLSDALKSLADEEELEKVSNNSLKKPYVRTSLRPSQVGWKSRTSLRPSQVGWRSIKNVLSIRNVQSEKKMNEIKEDL